jgi:hypothetical protein
MGSSPGRTKILAFSLDGRTLAASSYLHHPPEGPGGLGPRARDWIPTRRGVKMSAGAAPHFNYTRDTLKARSSSVLLPEKRRI